MSVSMFMLFTKYLNFQKQKIKYDPSNCNCLVKFLKQIFFKKITFFFFNF